MRHRDGGDVVINEPRFASLSLSRMYAERQQWKSRASTPPVQTLLQAVGGWVADGCSKAWSVQGEPKVRLVETLAGEGWKLKYQNTSWRDKGDKASSSEPQV